MENNKAAGELLDVNALAKMIAFGVRTCWRYAGAGLIPPPVKIGKLKRWRRVDIDKWTEGGCRPWRN